MKITLRFVLAVIVALATLFYMLPWSIAYARHKRNVVAIFFLDLLLGWSLIGWIGAFVWAWMKDAPEEKPRGKNASPLYNLD